MDLMDYRRKIIANSPHLSSASGDIVSFSDGADLPLKSLIVDIEPVQSGTGDPSPTNIRPISGWDAVKVTRTGKNLVNFANLSCEANIQYTTALGTVYLPAGTYTFSADIDKNITATRNRLRIAYDGVVIYGVDFLQSGRSSYTFTLDSAATVTFSWWYHTLSENIVLSDIQLEEGSTATPYEPYNGVNVSIDLGQTVYGGTLNPLTGVLTVDRGYSELSENWSWLGSSLFQGGYYVNKKGDLGYRFYTPFICSHAKSVASTVDYIFGTCYCDSTLNFRIMATDSTLQDWKDFIVAQRNAGTPIEICYELDTPFEIQLTPQQVRSLYGNNTIFADTGNIALEYWAHP